MCTAIRIYTLALVYIQPVHLVTDSKMKGILKQTNTTSVLFILLEVPATLSIWSNFGSLIAPTNEVIILR